MSISLKFYLSKWQNVYGIWIDSIFGMPTIIGPKEYLIQRAKELNINWEEI